MSREALGLWFMRANSCTCNVTSQLVDRDATKEPTFDVGAGIHSDIIELKLFGWEANGKLIASAPSGSSLLQAFSTLVCVSAPNKIGVYGHLITQDVAYCLLRTTKGMLSRTP